MIVYDFVFPLYIRLKCCGKYKPKQDVDTVDDIDEYQIVQTNTVKVPEDISINEWIHLLQTIKPLNQYFNMHQHNYAKEKHFHIGINS